MILDASMDIPDAIILKRTHSDCGAHIVHPGESGRTWLDLQRKLTVPEAKWFGQTYVSTLDFGGEWRVFLVGGKVVYTVHTLCRKSKPGWTNKHVDEFLSLDEIGSVGNIYA